MWNKKTFVRVEFSLLYLVSEFVYSNTDSNSCYSLRVSAVCQHFLNIYLTSELPYEVGGIVHILHR